MRFFVPVVCWRNNGSEIYPLVAFRGVTAPQTATCGSEQFRRPAFYSCGRPVIFLSPLDVSLSRILRYICQLKVLEGEISLRNGNSPRFRSWNTDHPQMSVCPSPAAQACCRDNVNNAAEIGKRLIASAAEADCIPDGRKNSGMPHPVLEALATRLFNGRNIGLCTNLARRNPGDDARTFRPLRDLRERRARSFAVWTNLRVSPHRGCREKPSQPVVRHARLRPRRKIREPRAEVFQPSRLFSSASSRYCYATTSTSDRRRKDFSHEIVICPRER